MAKGEMRAQDAAWLGEGGGWAGIRTPGGRRPVAMTLRTGRGKSDTDSEKSGLVPRGRMARGCAVDEGRRGVSFVVRGVGEGFRGWLGRWLQFEQ